MKLPPASELATASAGNRNFRWFAISEPVVLEIDASLFTCQLPMLGLAMSTRHRLPQVSPAYSQSAVPLRSRSITVRSEGMAQVIPATTWLLAAPLGVGPACQTTLPLNASTMNIARPWVREMTVAEPVALLIVQEPAGVL